MNKKLEPGMVCLIIGCYKNPIDVGKVCTLVELCSEGLGKTSNGIPYTIINGKAWYVIGENIHSYKGNRLCKTGDGFVRPQFLMPLKGDEIFETEEEQVHELTGP